MRKVQVRRATLVDDGLTSAEQWADHGDAIFAEKRDARDSEKWRSGEVGSHLTARFLVRYSAFTSDLTPKDRIQCGAEEFDISGIKEVDGPKGKTRQRFLEITAAARSDQ